MTKMINLVKILLLTGLIQLSNHVIKTNGAEVVLQNYKPVAMDESWSLNGRRFKDGLQSMSLVDTFKTSEPSVISGRVSNSILMDDINPKTFTLSDVKSKTRSDGVETIQLNTPSLISGKILDVETNLDADTKTNLFREPTKETSELTKLLKRQPTFIRESLVKPETFNPNGKGKVLATYSFMVPIYIPAVKKVGIKASARREPPKFVKETVTEMVPVTQNMPRVNEVIKAVKVPQKVITDFVEARGNSIPQSADDKVRPGEKVISTVVKDYD